MLGRLLWQSAMFLVLVQCEVAHADPCDHLNPDRMACTHTRTCTQQQMEASVAAITACFDKADGGAFKRAQAARERRLSSKAAETGDSASSRKRVPPASGPKDEVANHYESKTIGKPDTGKVVESPSEGKSSSDAPRV